MKFENSLAFARKVDKADPLKSYRKKFLIPKVNGKDCIYFTGNSLGLQPITTKKFVNEELEDWKKYGVEGHFNSRRPWLYYHKFTKKALAELTGSRTSEVVAMNQLTVNLHLMMVSFYRPDKKRFKILIEGGAFPSDQYAIESQIKFHGLDPETTLIELYPRSGENYLRTQDILDAIKENGENLSLVLFPGVQYYTGQSFDIKKITEAGHLAGAKVGFDLAHAIGNVPLKLHAHNVDFAVWCSYKYLNAGPGGIAGAFVHDRHAKDFSIPRFAGWWGHNEKERFEMKKGFKPMPGVDGWQLSNFPVLPGAALHASLEIFQQAGISRLRKKSEQLTGFMEFLLKSIPAHTKLFTILTPEDKSARGCQLSLFMHVKGRKVFDALTKAGVIADWREPNVIRVAPVPLYNTYTDVYRFAEVLRDSSKR